MILLAVIGFAVAVHVVRSNPFIDYVIGAALFALPLALFAGEWEVALSAAAILLIAAWRLERA